MVMNYEQCLINEVFIGRRGVAILGNMNIVVVVWSGEEPLDCVGEKVLVGHIPNTSLLGTSNQILPAYK
jgi:hypothetical protein